MRGQLHNIPDCGKHDEWLRHILTFMSVDGTTTLLHIIAGLAVHYLGGIDPFNANLVAFFVSFILHETYTFRFRLSGRVSRSMPRLFVILATNLLLSQAIVYISSTVYEQPYWIALVNLIAVVPAFAYLLGRILVLSEEDF